MSNPLLKATTSLCVGLLLMQPISSFAQTIPIVPLIEDVPCQPGQADCPPQTHKKPKAKKTNDKGAKANQDPTADGSAAPDEQAAPEDENALQTQLAPITDLPLADGPLADGPLADGPLADGPLADRPEPTDTAPNTRRLVAPDTQAPSRDTRSVRPEPVAPAAASHDTAIAPTAPVIKLQEKDVRRSDQTKSDRNTQDRSATTTNKHDSGLSDFEKFGLLALGAVVVGSMLSNGRTVVSNSDDRVVVRDENGHYDVMHDDNALVRRPGSTVSTQNFSDGSVLSRVSLDDGRVIQTVLDANGRVLRRTVEYPGRPTVVLFDDTRPEIAYNPAQLPPRSQVMIDYTDRTSRASLMRDFETLPPQNYRNVFSLRQIRDIREIRSLVPQADLSTLTFATGSAALSTDQAQTLKALGEAMSDLIHAGRSEVFLIEGHTNAVGDIASNFALSDARAESVALALIEYFGVPPENLVTQGYGESDLKIQTQGAAQANRRVVVRRITGLLTPVAGN